MQDVKSEVSVVGQEKQSFAIQIQSSNGIDSISVDDQVENSPPSVAVLRGAENAGRLIEDNVGVAGSSIDCLAVNSQRVGRQDARSQLVDYFPVHGDSTGHDQL